MPIALPSGTTAAGASIALEVSRGAPARRRVAFAGDVPFGAGGLVARRYRLHNGLTILLLPDHAAPVVSYQTWYAVGSRHEREGKTGLAHLFEHLMFNETESLPAGEFDRLMEGAGGETNAATWVDWTFYYENVPASEIATAIRLESDRMANLVLREKQLESEREVVANERRFRVDDDVEGSVGELLYATAFDQHPYRWPTIGWMKDILGFTTSDCRAFYRTYYAPNNATVVAVGDFEEADLLRLMVDAYCEYPRRKIPPHAESPEPTQLKERRLEVRKPTPTPKIDVGYRSAALGTADHAALTVISEILFGGRSARLQRALVTDGEMAAEVRGSVAPFRDPGLFEIWVSLREGQSIRRAERVLDRELGKLSRNLVPIAELEKARARIELGFLQGLETVSGKAEQLGFHEVTLGDASRAFERLERIRVLTPDDLRDVARRYLTPERRTVIRVLPVDASTGAS
ncbi:MAG: insulinase family protein [Deltaproteobacteria bacterium]|nr:insulinase family protein [Deltaproteobacteria bacterium]